MKKNKNNIYLVIFALISICIIWYSKSQQRIINEKPSISINYDLIIKKYVDRASNRNESTLSFFELDIEQTNNNFKSKLKQASLDASEEASDYSSLSMLIYHLAYDKVKNLNTTEIYLNDEIKPIINSILIEMKKENDKILNKLDFELQKNTVQLAYDLAELNKDDGLNMNLNVNIEDINNLDFQSTLRNLGFDAFGVSIGVIFDTYAIKKSKLILPILKKITYTASKMFSKQVIKASASVSTALADGPLPIGDIIAIGGLFWTGYDVIQLRKEFKNEINISINNLLNEIQIDVQKQLINNASNILDKYAVLQEDLGEQSLESLTK